MFNFGQTPVAHLLRTESFSDWLYLGGSPKHGNIVFGKQLCYVQAGAGQKKTRSSRIRHVLPPPITNTAPIAGARIAAGSTCNYLRSSSAVWGGNYNAV